MIFVGLITWLNMFLKIAEGDFKQYFEIHYKSSLKTTCIDYFSDAVYRYLFIKL